MFQGIADSANDEVLAEINAERDGRCCVDDRPVDGALSSLERPGSAACRSSTGVICVSIFRSQ
jgi:hypothetical protein